MKNIKYLKFSIIIFLLFSQCSGFYDTKKQNKSEEFLVEKKSPLVLPPDFKKLPVPDSQLQNEKENENVKNLIISKDKKNTQIQKSSNQNQSLEKSIIDKIQNN
tara:strand:+ start:323 stop:634 length:312 start_codon:yes stop_codon:yes gene_type:complete